MSSLVYLLKTVEFYPSTFAMVAITQLSLWISALAVFSCQALLVTYIVESETFCEINSTEIDTVSKSMVVFLDDVSTSSKQMNLTNDFIPVCTLNNVEIKNSTDLIGKKQPLVSEYACVQ